MNAKPSKHAGGPKSWPLVLFQASAYNLRGSRKTKRNGMRHFENNPRQITRKQFNKLQDTMIEFGDLSGIVHNLEDDQLIGGNQRSEAAKFINKNPVITESYDPPQADGTVAIGYFEYEGRRFSYRAVRWGKEKSAARGKNQEQFFAKLSNRYAACNSTI